MIKGLHFKALDILGRLLGAWAVRIVAWWTAAMYFIFARRRVSYCTDFYKALYPEEGWLRQQAHVWKQFQQFTWAYIDRRNFRKPGGFRFELEGDEHLSALVESGQGCVLLMSHLGNWEAAAYISNLKGYRMMIYMGRRDRKYLEQQQKRELSEAGVRLQAVGEDDGSPANAIEGFNHVRGGGFVAMSADRLWTPGQRRMQAAFHGRIIQLPAAPYALALAARVPLCAFFCVREKDGTFRLIVRPPVSISAARREEREQALASGARYYLNELDRMLPDYLHQWANFEPFFGPPAG